MCLVFSAPLLSLHPEVSLSLVLPACLWYSCSCFPGALPPFPEDLGKVFELVPVGRRACSSDSACFIGPDVGPRSTANDYEIDATAGLLK